MANRCPSGESQLGWSSNTVCLLTAAAMLVAGVVTFLVSHDGVVYEKDLGPDTEARATAMETFDPMLLSMGGQEIIAEGTAGGSSAESEAMAAPFPFKRPCRGLAASATCRRCRLGSP